MRVLDTTTLDFREFPDLPDEPYAILSHRWSSQEVTYKEYRKNHETVQHRTGYTKIVDFCQVAQKRGFHYAWVDTCCIDKRSSAELSEAINSMFRWYKESTECYVYLDDCNTHDSSSLGVCKWFSRGWTLQELLAPRHCVFFMSAWDVIGHKHPLGYMCPCEKNKSTPARLTCGPDVVSELATITKIPEDILSGIESVHAKSIAQRMSWASRRCTTRIEDRAYSLLGLFDINMPLLYGEGSRAFRRLQEEIIRTTHDTSIFCFDAMSTTFPTAFVALSYSGGGPEELLAGSPIQFSQCNDVSKGIAMADEVYSITHRGLCMVAPAYISPVYRDQPVYAIPLECNRDFKGRSETFFLFIQRGSGGRADFDKIALLGVDSPPEWNGDEDVRWMLTGKESFYIKL